MGNHFRDKLQSMPAVKFIETRQQVQAGGVRAHQRAARASTRWRRKGVYIQDVIFPEELVQVLTQREIANQEIATFQKQQRAQTSRIEMEKAKGTADMQAQLGQAQVGVEIKTNEAAGARGGSEG